MWKQDMYVIENSDCKIPKLEKNVSREGGGTALHSREQSIWSPHFPWSCLLFAQNVKDSDKGSGSICLQSQSGLFPDRRNPFLKIKHN